MPVAQRVGRIPADADQDNVDRETHSFKIEHAVSPRFRYLSLPEVATSSSMRQNFFEEGVKQPQQQ